jgi:hypothetical protein
MLKPGTASLLIAALVSLWSMGASALPNPTSLVPGCGCAGGPELSALAERISKAPNLDEARQLALAPVELSHKALSRALWLVPRSTSIRAAERRLSAYEAGVQQARSEAEVAQEFGQLVQLADSGGVVFDAHFLSSCSYSTGEIVAIVIGFILGILPGIILLIILC